MDDRPSMSKGGLRAAVTVAVAVGTLAIAPFTVQRCPDGTIRYWGAPPCPPPAIMDAPAFPAAVGFGMYTCGGRGGDVYHVTTTAATGAGSFHEGISSATGPRTIVFDVGGTTEPLSAVYSGKKDLTIAGETAPGGGFCVQGDLRFEGGSNIIVRGIRVRAVPLANTTKWCLLFLNGDRIYVDRCSFSWSTDEMLSFSTCTNVTVANSLFAEWCRIYTADGNAGKSAIFCRDCDRVTIWRNVMSTTGWRQPIVSGGLFQVWENVMYNRADHACMILAGIGSQTSTWAEIVSNLHLTGPATEIRWPLVTYPSAQTVEWLQVGNGFDYGDGTGYVYQSDNKGDNDRANGVLDLVDGRFDGAYTVQATPWSGVDEDWPVLPTPAAIDAAWMSARLAEAGAQFTSRDAADTRIIAAINNRASASTGTVSYLGATMSDTYPLDPAEVGGYPTLATGSAPLDTDQDGMPDSYEDANGLLKTQAGDGMQLRSDGYSNLDAYLNTLID